ncbi:metalloregulator ArsR/SmtB family transcription factor [Shewanella sp. WXL01]|nr:metalloregulator ArsR/SmtB family transcription factor [Shewanella sp. WXL01]
MTRMMQLDPISLFKSLSDPSRLAIIMMLKAENELCVCEFTEALNEVQPKISRNLALLKTNGVVVNRREGQWIYYSINPELPEWAQEVVNQTYAGNHQLIADAMTKLEKVGPSSDRPNILCCGS